jgi:hypothetical protein
MLSRGSKSEAELPEIHSQAEPENEKNEKSQAEAGRTKKKIGEEYDC